MAKKSTLTRPIKDLLDREVEKPVLENLYLELGVATDQLRRHHETLLRITRAFNQLTGRDFDEGILLRYMLNRRKVRDWPKLGPRAKKFQSVLHLLSAAETEILKTIYRELDITSDKFLFKTEPMTRIAHRFQEVTGRRLPGPTLVAVIIAKRKRGEWVKIREAAFGDIAALRTAGA